MSYDEEWGYVSAKIKGLLEANGWSISSFADTYNIDRANLSRIVSGAQKDTRFSTLHKIADAFGLNISDLLPRGKK